MELPSIINKLRFSLSLVKFILLADMFGDDVGRLISQFTVAV